MTTRVVKTVFVVDTAQAEQAASRVEQRYAMVDQKANQAVSNSISAVQRQALGLSAQLRQIGDATIGTKGVDGLGRAAMRAQKDVRKTYSELRSLESLMAVSREPALIKALEREIAKASGDLDRLQLKMQRVAAGREAARLRNAANGIDGRGALGVAAGAGVPFASEAALGIEGAAALGISTAGLAAFGAVAAAGYGIVKLTQQMREEALKRLKVEEQIAVAVNQQRIAGQEVIKSLVEQRKIATEQRELQKDITSGTKEQLDSRLKLLQTFVNLAPLGPNAQRNGQNIQAIDEELARREAQKTIDANSSFEARNTEFKNAQRQRAEAEKKAAEAFAASVERGKEKVKELGIQYRDTFKDLNATANQQNPFVAVFSSAASLLDSIREKTRGLKPELREVYENIARSYNRTQLFEARLNTAIEVDDLRSQADRFQRYNPAYTTDTRLSRLNASFQDEFKNGMSGRNVDEIQRYYAGEEKRILGEEAEANRRRLDEQISVIKKTPASTREEASIINQRLIALLGGRDPGSLNQGQRDTVASALLQEADARARREIESQGILRNQLNMLQRIEQHEKTLVAIAAAQGGKAIELIINNQSEQAAEAKQRSSRPTPNDTNKMYPTSLGLPIAGGTNL